jgi:hypothetical protein
LLADAFAVGLDPVVVAAVGERTRVGVDRAAQRRRAVGVAVGVAGLGVAEGGAQPPQVDVDELFVKGVVLAGVGEVAARSGGAPEGGAQVGDVGVCSRCRALLAGASGSRSSRMDSAAAVPSCTAR